MQSRIVALLVLFLITTNNAYAEPALSRFDALLKEASIPIDGVAGSVATQGVKPVNLRIDFKAAATQAQREQANGLADSFNWLDTAEPRPSQFVIDCVNDAVIPAAQRQNIAIAGLSFKAGEKSLALTIWNLIKTALAANPTAISAIRTHAANNGITLP